MSINKRRTVVIGLGNPLMGDDGLGLAVLDELRTGYAFPPDVELVDGGTWGMNLLPVIEDADELILIDAIDVGATPGAFVRLEHHRLPRYLATKISPHQVDLRDVLALAELRGTLPADTVALAGHAAGGHRRAGAATAKHRAAQLPERSPALPRGCVGGRRRSGVGAARAPRRRIPRGERPCMR